MYQVRKVNMQAIKIKRAEWGGYEIYRRIIFYLILFIADITLALKTK